MGQHYNAGYLAAVRAGTFAARGVMRRVPAIAVPLDTLAGQSWWMGVCDAVSDAAHARQVARR